MKKQLLPILKVRGPDNQAFNFEVTKERITVGRSDQHNDIGLEPDPEQFVTRIEHCIIERNADGWWIIDNKSRNKTSVERRSSCEIVNGRTIIADGDIIHIPAWLPESQTETYWEIIFNDPLMTRQVENGPSFACLEYDQDQAKLFYVDGHYRQEISEIRPQEHKLIRYMDQRNREKGTPTMCTYDELITAVWGDEMLHTKREVFRLVWELRKKVESDPETPQFLQAVEGFGYRLVMCPST